MKYKIKKTNEVLQKLGFKKLNNKARQEYNVSYNKKDVELLKLMWSFPRDKIEEEVKLYMYATADLYSLVTEPDLRLFEEYLLYRRNGLEYGHFTPSQLIYEIDSQKIGYKIYPSGLVLVGNWPADIKNKTDLILDLRLDREEKIMDYLQRKCQNI